MSAAPASTNDVGSYRGDGVPARGRKYDRWLLPIGLTASYVLFAVAVHLRLLDTLDISVRDTARPGDVWGPVQIRAARVVVALQPGHVALPLLLVIAVVSLLRRSLRPLWVMAVIAVPVVVVTVGTKWAMAHCDASTVPVDHGSFPSGHTVVAGTACGVVVLLFRPGTRWRWMLPTAAGCVMGSALVLASVHPATDVIGAGLLTAAALAAAAAAALGQWASESSGPTLRRPMG